MHESANRLTFSFQHLQLFYYILPYGYYVRSFIYTSFTDATWEACTDPAGAGAVCVDSTDGLDVLDGLGRIFPLIESQDTVWQDVGIMVGIAVFFKIVSIIAIIFKTSKVAAINTGGHSIPSIKKKTKSPTKTDAPKQITSKTTVAPPAQAFPKYESEAEMEA